MAQLPPPKENTAPVDHVTSPLLPGVQYLCTRAAPIGGHPEIVNLIVQQPRFILPPRHVPLQRGPSHYMSLSICGCLCCLCPIGIIAIILSIQVKYFHKKGDLRSARKYSEVTLIVNVLNILAGIIAIISWLRYEHVV